jgi:predicted nuclease with TOPRIM domain
MNKALVLVVIAVILALALFLFNSNNALKTELSTAKKDIDQIGKEFNRLNEERVKLREEGIKYQVDVAELKKENESLRAGVTSGLAEENAENPFAGNSGAAPLEREIVVTTAEQEEAARLKVQLDRVFTRENN